MKDAVPFEDNGPYEYENMTVDLGVRENSRHLNLNIIHVTSNLCE